MDSAAKTSRNVAIWLALGLAGCQTALGHCEGNVAVRHCNHCSDGEMRTPCQAGAVCAEGNGDAECVIASLVPCTAGNRPASYCSEQTSVRCGTTGYALSLDQCAASGEVCREYAWGAWCEKPSGIACSAPGATVCSADSLAICDCSLDGWQSSSCGLVDALKCGPDSRCVKEAGREPACVPT